MNDLRSNLVPFLFLLGVLAVGFFVLRRPTATVTVSRPSHPTDATARPAGRAYEIVTLLPRDAIPAIDRPRFYSAAEADVEYEPDERVLGVSLNGESRAYSTSLLNHHEIVNDTVGGTHIAVTW